MLKKYPFARTCLFLLPAVFLLSACAQKQNPTPSDTGGMGSDSGDIIPPGPGEEYGFGAEGLEPRGEGEQDGFYNGRKMVEGKLDPVYFDFDSSAISSEERSKLQEAAEYLEDNSSEGLLIEGHCDWHGTAEYNLALGDRRAKSARDYLAQLGIDEDRLNTRSKGDLEATPDLSKSQAAEDRRADLIVLE
ncbi:MAG: OmpA family protein [Opitutales bacterium]